MGIPKRPRMKNYVVNVNYPSKRIVSDTGITTEFTTTVLESFDSKQEAMKFARRYKPKIKKEKDEYVYVIDKEGNCLLSLNHQREWVF